jgi:hypothetical protein
MIMRLGTFLVAALLGSCAAPPPVSAPRQATELTGRVAGPPQRCVIIERGEGLRVAEGDRHTLVYGRGRTVWANHLGPGCGLGANDILILEPIGSHYCRGDLVHSLDPVSRIPGQACILGDFVPYLR